MRLLLGILLLVAAGFSVVSASGDAFADRPLETIYAAAGDTVWDIAARRTTPHEDIRELINAIRQINHLDASARIYPGQALQVPVRR